MTRPPVAKHTYTYFRGSHRVFIVMKSPGVGERTVATFPKAGGFLLANAWAKERGVKLERS